MIKDCSIRAAKEEDVLLFFEERPPFSLRAWVVEYKGQVVSISGLHYTPMGVIVFIDILEIEDIPKLTIWRCSKLIWEKMKKLEDTLFAFDGREYPNSGNYIKRYGFELISSSEEGDMYAWHR